MAFKPGRWSVSFQTHQVSEGSYRPKISMNLAPVTCRVFKVLGTRDTPIPDSMKDTTLVQWRTSCFMLGMKPFATHMETMDSK